MAQTKRKKRSTKHRGNAAGSIEARGRTGRKPTAEEQKKAGQLSARERRQSKPPSWNSAALKAGAMAILLFVLTQVGFLAKDATVASGLAIACIAMLLYTPLAFWTDKWAYARQQRKLAAGSGR
jgi:hypothetical protein